MSKQEKKQHYITVSGITAKVTYKNIKNLHLSVNPPEGEVRVSSPLHLTDENIRLMLIHRLPWIKKHQANFRAQPRQTEREMVSGESHYFLGHRYRLRVIERVGRHEVTIKNKSWLELYVNPNTSRENRQKVLHEWYRAELKRRIPKLIAKWEPIIGKKVSDWGVKRMKTKWGSCNTTQKRIWLNLELAKKPVECLEYVVVHEMVHLLERRHNDRFWGYMDRFLPKWRQYEHRLKQYPLAHEKW